MTITNQHRHGDVLLTPLDDNGNPLRDKYKEPPADAKRVKRLILAYGEATGSAHVVEGDFWTWEENGVTYVMNEVEAILQQERYGKVLDAPDGHAPQTMQPDVRRYLPQQELTLDEEWVRVAD